MLSAALLRTIPNPLTQRLGSPYLTPMSFERFYLLVDRWRNIDEFVGRFRTVQPELCHFMRFKTLFEVLRKIERVSGCRIDRIDRRCSNSPVIRVECRWAKRIM